MVRMGGLGYTLNPTQTMGNRIGGMVLLRTGAPIEASRDYAIAGWASINQGTDGPPIWQIIENYLKNHGTIRPQVRQTVKLVGA